MHNETKLKLEQGNQHVVCLYVFNGIFSLYEHSNMRSHMYIEI